MCCRHGYDAALLEQLLLAHLWQCTLPDSKHLLHMY